jgi:DNA-binding transcriptional regulator YiaG
MFYTWLCAPVQFLKPFYHCNRALFDDERRKEKFNMPNIASALKDEIVRLARKEVRKEVEGIRKASVQYRSDIAGLKRRVAELEKLHSRLEKKSSREAEPKVSSEEGGRVRFSAKGLAAHRQRLALSAADLGSLMGVSAQTVYNWEAGKTKPRPQQLAAVAALRKLGKREAKAQLANLAN